MNLVDISLCKTISSDICLPLRQKILWPDQSQSFSVVEGDQQATHFGLFIEGDLVSCLSFFSVLKNAETMQLRKFCTETVFQSKGLGSHLLYFATTALKASGVRHVFANSRQMALPFYLKNGFATEGDIFVKHGMDYVKVIKSL